MSSRDAHFSSRSLRVAVLGIAALYVGSTILTPLYPLYPRSFGLSELTVTEIYAVYVLGNLAVLFLFGRLSDQVGRRPTALAALAVTGLSAACSLAAPGVGWLVAGRVTVACGAAMALGDRGSLQIVAEIAPDDRRAELLASYLVCYTGNSLPIVGLGLLSRAAGPEMAHRLFALVLALLALVAGAIGGTRRFGAAGPALSGAGG